MRSPRTYFSTHRVLSTAVVATAVLVMGAGIAFGVISTSPSSDAAATNPTTALTTPTTQASPAPRPAARKRRAVRGVLTAVSSEQWTVRTVSGVTVTVHITPATTFGTPARPASASSLMAGDEVVVIGVRQGSTVTATRIWLAPTRQSVPTTTTPAAPE